jgi:DNA-binding NarL/FixJ family response regulator
MTTVRGELTVREHEIAAELRIADRTVEWNLTRIYRKLGIRSKVELAAACCGNPVARRREQ